MKLFKKIILLLPLFVLATSAYANYMCDPCEKEEPTCYDECTDHSKNKPYDQGHELCPDSLPKAHNAPARIDVCQGLDTYITGSFIYWQMLGDWAQLGFLYIDSTTNPVVGRDLDFSYKYKPGFKVGIGQHFDHDDWDVYVNYTRLVANNSFNYTFGGNEGLISPYVVQSFGPGQGVANFNTSWKRKLNKVDLECGRHYYMGTHAILMPYIGITAHWLKQNFDFTTYNLAGGWATSTEARSRSWAVGPRFGLNTQWLLGSGFRFFGNTALNLLYAETKTKGDYTDYIFITRHFEFLTDTNKTIRFVPELLLGMGWGTYFYNDRSHFDLSVGYELQYYSQTNYFTHYITQGIEGASTGNREMFGPGNMYLHGLTVTARFDF